MIISYGLLTILTSLWCLTLGGDGESFPHTPTCLAVFVDLQNVTEIKEHMRSRNTVCVCVCVCVCVRHAETKSVCYSEIRALVSGRINMSKLTL